MVRPDNLAAITTLPTYLNESNTTNTIVISGTIADGFGQNFSCTLPYTITSQTVKADIYASNNVTALKELLNNITIPFGTYSSTGEIVSLAITYGTSTITVEYQVFNGTGAPVTLTDQTITVQAVLYRVPF